MTSYEFKHELSKLDRVAQQRKFLLGVACAALLLALFSGLL